MNLKYYVLASKNNQMLKSYEEKYYLLLLEKLEFISLKTWKINFDFKNIKYKNFILFPDIQALINYIFDDFKNNTTLKYTQNSVKKEFLETRTVWAVSEFRSEKNSFFTKNNLYLDKLLTEFEKQDKDDYQSNLDKIKNTNIILSTFDLSPYNQFEAHPDHIKSWAVMWYWEQNKDFWLKVYFDTFELLKKIDFWFYEELNYIIKKIIPLWTAYNMHNSASYKECVWSLYLWITLWVENPEIFNLEAIIHESSHNKLNLIMHFDKILLNDKSEIYYSSIRPDARPMIWVFLWLHAFVPTMYVLAKWYNLWLIKSDIILDKMALYYLKTKLLYKVLKKYAILTIVWSEILTEIEFCLKLLDIEIRKINLPQSSLENAKNNQNKHFLEVCKNYKYLKY